MILLIVIQVLYSIATLIMAGKDADSYLLKDNSGSRLNLTRVNRWHRDGLLLAAIVAGICALVVMAKWWFILSAAFFIRLSFFDISFNHWAGLSESYLGGTAKTDVFFIKIFGLHGAWRKSGFFFILLLLLNYFFR